jgi:hypothetical protein
MARKNGVMMMMMRYELAKESLNEVSVASCLPIYFLFHALSVFSSFASFLGTSLMAKFIQSSTLISFWRRLFYFQLGSRKLVSINKTQIQSS